MSAKFPMPTEPPSHYPREHHDRGDFIYRSALAEVGIHVKCVWNESLGCYVNTPPVPEPWHSRARIIVYESLGMPWEWVES